MKGVSECMKKQTPCGFHYFTPQKRKHYEAMSGFLKMEDLPARQQFIKECFSVTATRELPTKSEFIEAKVSNVEAFPELRDTPFK